ncbi:gamma carbonic anhydrase family protein [Fodinicola acaciae]|uniref:gamma carbonic anhydrase family protein n=1 Tax=Fodinicola acaciae TaxID=2681555 RepID=UPI0013D7C82B|nr:gamma carbonic anhydrase family protein [Fodinicola acaciae]
MTEPFLAAIGDRRPHIDDGAFLAAGCRIIGDVRIGTESSIWYGTTIRADTTEIVIGAQTNIQDHSVLHADPGFPTRVGDRVSVGHNVVIHGSTVEDDVLVGMSATLLNGTVVGAFSIIAAGATVLENTRIPAGSLVVGTPARVVRELSEADRQRISVNAEVYRYLAQEHRSLKRL